MARKPTQPSNIPTAVAVVPFKKAKRNAAYKMYSEMSKAASEALGPVETKDLETMVGDHLRVMMPPEGQEEVTLPAEVYTQMALFANAYLTRALYERYRK